MKTYAMILLSVFIAELGDKTQLATVLFATDSALSRWGVLAAAAAALVASTALAVAAGSLLGTWVAARHLRLAGALGFIAIGVWMLARR
jgi:putative Ca2+/H+ antiporter (TMEM165/GDT1 family)